MQNGAHDTSVQGRLLGFVRVSVGGQVFEVAVQAMALEKDTADEAGGFFEHDGELGILVDDKAPEPEVKAQIARATQEAIRHLSRRCLN